MDLTVRPVEERDLPACIPLLEGHRAYPRELLVQLPRFWRRLLREDALVGSVVETVRPGGSSFVCGFGASVFVREDWITRARESSEPFLTARTVQAHLEGRSPLLARASIRRHHQAGGLNVLILHYGEAREVPVDERRALRRLLFEHFVEMHRGYRLREVLQEFWDEIDPEYVRAGWGLVRNEYRGYFERRRATSSDGPRPVLIGITREESLATPGFIGAALFVDASPVLSLTRAEKRMLRAALSGLTDVELAKTLGVALPTVKSRWRGIYDRVGRAEPALLSRADEDGRSPSVRGQEKRRRLLEYLRRHPEELQPLLR